MPEKERTAFGKRLKKLLNEASMTQEDLAERLIVNKALITLWSYGNRDPRREHVMNMIKVFIEKKALEFRAEADLLLKDANKEPLDDDAISDKEIISKLRATLTDSENSKKDVALAYFVITAILLVFAIVMVPGTPILPDEIIPGLLAILTGRKGYDELMTYLDLLEKIKPSSSNSDQ